MMVHMIDLILWYFGDVKHIENLYTDTVLKYRKIEDKIIEANAEDLVLLKMEMEKGVRVICEGDLITPSYMNYIEIHGTNGSIWASILDFFPTIVYCKEPRGVYDRGCNFFKFPRIDLFEKELSYFIKCIRNGEKPEINSIEDSIKIMELLESIEEDKNG